MDDRLAIDINREELLQIVAGLFAMIGGAVVATVARWMHLTVLDELRPAESATRRLIAMLAHRMIAPERAARKAPVGSIPRGDGKDAPAFALFDPRKRVGPFVKRVPGRGPGVWSLDDARHVAPGSPPPSPDDPVDAGRLCKRLQALEAALADLPRQARRLARVLARQVMPKRAMRPGRPPGWRAKRRHPVDAILDECQKFALMVLNEPPGRVPP